MTLPPVIDLILQHKENIVPLENGRSALKLSLLLKPPKSHAVHKDRLLAERALHERQLSLSDESDDPLQLYLDYISWTNTCFPSGPSNDSGLVPLLERCTSVFRDTPLYRNDPRYLSIWLLYSQYSDCPKDIFVYLAKKKIGMRLAVYYERFAAYLESAGNFEEARLVYTTGIENEAFPLVRLRKSFELFCSRMQNTQPSSARIPLTLQEGNPTESTISLGQPPSKRAKFTCHVDTEPAPLPSIFAEPAHSPQAPADRSTRIKENVMAASTWAGAIIEPRIPLVRAESSLKFAVFRDEGTQAQLVDTKRLIPSDNNGRSYTVVSQGEGYVSFVCVPGKRPENVQLNMDLLYNDDLCPLELLSIHKSLRLLAKPQKTSNKKSEPLKTVLQSASLRLPITSVGNEPTLDLSPDRHLTSRNDNWSDVKNVEPLHQSISGPPPDLLHLRSFLESASGNLPLLSLPVSHSTRSLHAQSPKTTNTLNNNHSIASRPNLNSENSVSAISPLAQSPQKRTFTETVHPTMNENVRTAPVNNVSAPYHSELTAILDIPHELDPLPYHHEGVASPTVTGFSRAANQEVYAIFNSAANEIKSTHDDFKMDDDPTITNYDGFVTETIHLPQQALQPQQTPPTDTEAPDCSSPFVELPGVSRATAVNPRDPNVQNQLLQTLSVPLSSFAGYFDMSCRKVARASRFQAITDIKTKSITKGSRLAMIDFCGDGLFCLRHQLGKGGYGTVYLTELESCGSLGALKIESPAARWEFYILCQIHRRLAVSHGSAQDFVVRPHSLYLFQDESYLFMDYCSQGNLLDLVNMHKSNQKSVDEALCAHLTIQLLRATDFLHQNNIVHGDLKADNCMLRFEPCHLDDEYSANTNSPWQKKSITLIDFGKSIDLHLFEKHTSFVDEKGIAFLKFEADLLGLADTIHTLLFGEYLKTIETNGVRTLARPLKRYWLAELWTPLFNFLLNPCNGDTLQTHRQPFEQWLKDHSRSKKLKDTIASVERNLIFKRLK